MTTRRKFIQQSSFGLCCTFIPPFLFSSGSAEGFEGLIVNDTDGDAYMLRDGSAIVKIKISKIHGSETFSFLASTLPPGDVIWVHKHMNEDEFFFIHKGSGIFTLGEKEYSVSEGACMVTPRGVWHGLRNTGTENIEMRFGYTPSGFEGFFREVGIPVGQPFIEKTPEQRKAIAKKWGMFVKE